MPEGKHGIEPATIFLQNCWSEQLHAYARANRFRELHTTNVRHNKAMLDLNDELGYVIVESSGGYELALSA